MNVRRTADMISFAFLNCCLMDFKNSNFWWWSMEHKLETKMTGIEVTDSEVCKICRVSRSRIWDNSSHSTVGKNHQKLSQTQKLIFCKKNEFSRQNVQLLWEQILAKQKTENFLWFLPTVHSWFFKVCVCLSNQSLNWRKDWISLYF